MWERGESERWHQGESSRTEADIEKASLDYGPFTVELVGLLLFLLLFLLFSLRPKTNVGHRGNKEEFVCAGANTVCQLWPLAGSLYVMVRPFFTASPTFQHCLQSGLRSRSCRACRIQCHVNQNRWDESFKSVPSQLHLLTTCLWRGWKGRVMAAIITAGIWSHSFPDTTLSCCIFKRAGLNKGPITASKFVTMVF